MWNRIKKLFSGDDESERSKVPPIPLIPADAPDNPYKVALLDVQPVTQHMLSFTRDKKCAENAMSFRSDDGKSFIGAEPESQDLVDTSLIYPFEEPVLDGPIFLPAEMEHKWAIFYQRPRIVFVRSWTRKVAAVARTEIRDGYICLKTIRGSFAGIDSGDLTTRIADFLIRTLAFQMGELAPIPPPMFLTPEAAALWCMNVYGRHAKFATSSPYTSPRPISHPFRTNSLFHIAAARGDLKALEEFIEKQALFGVLSVNGLTPLHWSLFSKENEAFLLLLDRGCPIDIRAADGATVLMLASESRSLERTKLLLDRGADPNASDLRGFTALHRACEMGELEIAKLLLSRGARKDLQAQGFTARDLATKRSEAKMVALLDSQ